ncbi:MAG: hypothetical protein R2754_04720 [Microthrixaceae bacterium]
MPTLWTPDGERNVERETPPPASAAEAERPASGPQSAASQSSEPGPAGADDSPLSATELRAQAEAMGIDLDSLSPEERAQAEAAVADMVETRARLAQSPAAEVIANHLMGFYELAAIHLSKEAPGFADAALAIDALRAVLERVGDRLGEAGPVLTQAQQQIQMAFVQVKDQHATNGAPDPGEPSGNGASDAAPAEGGSEGKPGSDGGADPDGDQ